MATSSWDRLWDLFHRAIALPPDERAGFVANQAGDNHTLKQELEALIDAHGEGDGDDAIDRGLETLRKLDAVALLGSMIGPYELTDVLGEGGMGVVYAAEQTAPIRRRVALKLIRPGMGSREIVARFESERQALALMSHPAIAQVLDAGASDDGRPYFVMEYVPGTPITAYCDQHRLALAERIELFLQVLDAVQHAHVKGIIHRDLKPSNILVVARGGKAAPKIIDFGIAKAMTERLTDKTLHTRLGFLIGTPSYMSPEQADHTTLDVDTRTDIYALGVLLFELATGRRPHDHDGDQAPSRLLSALRDTVPPRPSRKLDIAGDAATEIAARRSTSPEKLRRAVSGDLDWIVLKALAPDRDRRYASVGEFAKDLRRYFANEPVIARAPSAAYRARKFVARHKLAVAAAAAIAVAVMLGMAGLTAGLIKARESQAEAERERNYALSVNEYLQSILTAASPYVAQGADTDLLQKMLDDAAARIEDEAAGQPRLAADLHGTIAGTYRALGRLDRAEFHARQALEYIEALEPGQDSPRALAARGRIALVLWAQGRMEESLATNREILAVQESTLGRSHPDTMTTMNNIALALKGLGRFDEAEALYSEIVERRTGQLGPTHRATLIAGNNLANLYRDTNQPAKAERLMSDIVARAESALGPNDPDTIAFADSYGNILVKLGRLDEAESLHLEVVERMRAVNGADHPDTMGAVYHLGQLYMAKGDYEQAEAQFRTAYETIAATLGEEHRYAVFSSAWMAKSLMKQERWAEAETVLHRSLETSRKIFPPDHSQTWRLECRLGVVLAERGVAARARELLRRCSPRLNELPGEGDEDRRQARAYLKRLESRQP